MCKGGNRLVIRGGTLPILRSEKLRDPPNMYLPLRICQSHTVSGWAQDFIHLQRLIESKNQSSAEGG